MSLKKTAISTISVLTVLMAGQSALAQSRMSNPEKSFATRDTRYESEFVRETAPHIGVLGGVGDTPGGSNGGMVGIDAGIQIAPPISIGLSGTFAGISKEFERTTVLGKVAYNLGGNIPVVRYMFMGANLGWVNDSFDLGEDASVSNDYFAVGPTVGFDQPIQEHFTIGAEAKYLFNFTDIADNSLQVNGALKYWF